MNKVNSFSSRISAESRERVALARLGSFDHMDLIRDMLDRASGIAGVIACAAESDALPGKDLAEAAHAIRTELAFVRELVEDLAEAGARNG